MKIHFIVLSFAAHNRGKYRHSKTTRVCSLWMNEKLPQSYCHMCCINGCSLV